MEYTLKDKTHIFSMENIIPGIVYLFICFSFFSIAGTQIALGLAIVILGVHMIITKHWLVRRTSLDSAFLLFCIACLISTIFSIRPHDSFMNLKNLLLISTVYVLSTGLRKAHHIEVAMDIFIFVSAVIAAIGLLNTDISGGARVRAFQSVTMTWGAMAAMSALIALSLFLFGSISKKRWLYLIAFLLQFVSMLFSYVRGSWLGFVAGVLIFIFFKSKKLFLLAFTLLILVYLISPAPVKTRIKSITDLNVNSTHVRLVQWSNAVKIFRDYPILGVGWIDLSELHRSYAPPGADLTRHEYNIGHFHNNLIMFLIYLGLVGFAAGVFLIIKLFQTTYRCYRHVPPTQKKFYAWALASLAVVTCFWTNGLFDWTFGDAEPVTLFWSIIGITLAIDYSFARGNA
jgi:putative inorganic carbon (HCO3(-)) transporter